MLLLSAAAAECVRIAVESEVHCVAVPDGSTVAEALAERARVLGRPAPRYDGNFLCAIDGNPQAPECGNDPPNPYWAFWVFRDGRWAYSSEGVATYPVGDTDGDGHPDPLGFHFQPVDGDKRPPAANPAYPKATPRPTRTPTPHAATTAAHPAATTTPGNERNPVASVTASGARATRTADAPTTAHPTAPTTAPRTAPTTSPGPGSPVPLTATDSGGGLPLGTIGGGVLALALLGATAVRLRKQP